MTEICVGIATDGAPVLEPRGKFTLLRNMLIGRDFHWQRPIEALLPGEVLLTPKADFRVINRLPIETYLECVVGSEMNPDAPAEFLKAHAIISRSWALGKITGSHSHNSSGKVDSKELIVNWEDTGDHHGFHVCSDDHCQRYQGIQPIREEIREAIRATSGLVLRTPDGALVDARFSKCCGGHTEVFSSCWQNREEQCLESFDDPWCNLEELSEPDKNNILYAILKDYDLVNGGGFRWHTTVSADDVRRNLAAKFGRDVGDICNLKITQRGKSGRATRILVEGSDGNVEIGKELMIRRLLSPTHLYSSWIDISPQSTTSSSTFSSSLSSSTSSSFSSSLSTLSALSPSSASSSGIFKIEGRGWGHGVGLCQIGAARMALEGRSFREILSFYYPNAYISNLSFASSTYNAYSRGTYCL